MPDEVAAARGDGIAAVTLEVAGADTEAAVEGAEAPLPDPTDCERCACAMVRCNRASLACASAVTRASACFISA